MKYDFKPDEGCDYRTIAEYDEYDFDEETDDWEYYYDMFKDQVDEQFIFPIKLEAANSNWRGQTGYATADNVEELLSKCFSFGNHSLILRINDQGFYFRTASHDAPTGFNIYIDEQK